MLSDNSTSTSFSPDLRALGLSCSLFAVRSCVHIPFTLPASQALGTFILLHPVLQITGICISFPNTWQTSLLKFSETMLLISSFLSFLESCIFAVFGFWSCLWSMLYSLLIILLIKKKISIPQPNVMWALFGAGSTFLVQRLFLQKTLSSSKEQHMQAKEQARTKSLLEEVAPLLLGGAIMHLASSSQLEACTKSVFNEHQKRLQEELDLFSSDEE